MKTTWKTFEQIIRWGRNRSIKAKLVTDDDDDDDDDDCFELIFYYVFLRSRLNIIVQHS